MFPPKKGKRVKEMIKSFFEWFFRDSIKILSPSLDESSKRLGKIISIPIGIFFGWYFLLIFGEDLPAIMQPSSSIGEISVLLVCAIIGIRIFYKVFRILFLVVDGLMNPK